MTEKKIFDLTGGFSKADCLEYSKNGEKLIIHELKSTETAPLSEAQKRVKNDVETNPKKWLEENKAKGTISKDVKEVEYKITRGNAKSRQSWNAPKNPASTGRIAKSTFWTRTKGFAAKAANGVKAVAKTKAFKVVAKVAKAGSKLMPVVAGVLTLYEVGDLTWRAVKGEEIGLFA